MRVVFTAEALERVAEIERYIEERNPAAAVEIVEKLIVRSESLTGFPRMGREVPEIGDDRVREIVEGNYRLVYRIVDDDRIEVVTVFDARRSFPWSEISAD